MVLVEKNVQEDKRQLALSLVMQMILQILICSQILYRGLLAKIVPLLIALPVTKMDQMRNAWNVPLESF